MMKIIETEYHGYKFRSRLEARWAVFFDYLGIEWRYEDEGFDLDGTWYLPDFFLPGLDCFLEVKGNANEPTILSDGLGKLFLLQKQSGKNCYLFSDFDKYGICIGDLNNTWSGWSEENGIGRKNELTSLTYLNGFNSCALTKKTFPTIHELVYGFSQDDLTPVFTIPDDSKDLKTMQYNQEFFHGIYGNLLDDPDDEAITLINLSNDHKLTLAKTGLFISNSAYFGEDIFCQTPGILALTGSYKKFCNCNPRSITASPLLAPKVVRAANAARQARFEHGEKPFIRKPKR